MALTNLNIRIDEDIKKQSESLFAGLGMNMTTAINVFLRQAIRKGGVPFEIVDPFYGEYNQRRIRETIDQFNADGIVVVKSLAELETMATDE